MTKEQLLEQAKPILFNTDMVQATLDDRKSCTRRVAKGIVPFDESGKFNALIRGEWTGPIPKADVIQLKSKYKSGDILYVRETWAFMECISCDGSYRRPENDPPCYDTQAVEYDDGDSISDGCFIYRADCRTPERIIWRPSIHMPKAAAHIFLKVTDVRMEKLKDMNLDDFLSEGVEPRTEAFNDPENAYWQARKIFSSIWDSTIPKNKLNKYGFDANPFVLAYEFERIIPEDKS